MIVDAILAITIIALLAFIAWDKKLQVEKEKKLLNAIIAKNSMEQTQLDMVDKTHPQISKPAIDVPPDLIPEGMANESLFAKAIQEEINGTKKDDDEEQEFDLSY